MRGLQDGLRCAMEVCPLLSGKMNEYNIGKLSHNGPNSAALHRYRLFGTARAAKVSMQSTIVKTKCLPIAAYAMLSS